MLLFQGALICLTAQTEDKKLIGRVDCQGYALSSLGLVERFKEKVDQHAQSCSTSIFALIGRDILELC